MEYIKVSNIKELKDSSKYYIFDFIDEYRCYRIDDIFYNFYRKNKNSLTKIYAPLYYNRGIIIIRNSLDLNKESFNLFFSKEYNIKKFKEPFEIRAKELLKIIKNIVKKDEDIKVNINKKVYKDKMVYYELNTNRECDKDSILISNNNIRKELIKHKSKDDELYNELFPIEKKINLCIAKDCFVRCMGCYNIFCNKSNLDIDHLFGFLEFAKSKGLEKVTLSGGDPLTMDNIIPIIEKCISLDLDINLDTVGLSFIDDIYVYGTDKKISKFDKNKLDILKRVKMIGVPLDGSNDEIIKEFRLFGGNLFEKQIKVIDFLEDNNISFCINTVAHQGNKDDLYNIYNIIKNYKNLKKWQVFEFMPIGIYGYNNKDKFELDKNEYLEKVNNLRNQIDTKLDIDFKSMEERSYNYMLVNSNGDAYKVDLDNKVEIFGNLNKKSDWDKIVKNLF